MLWTMATVRCVVGIVVDGSWLSALCLPFAHWLGPSTLMHDGSHFALCRWPWLNTFCAYIGSAHMSPSTWNQQHVVGHHSHTNIEGRDPDLYHFTFLSRNGLLGFRVSPVTRVERTHSAWRWGLAVRCLLTTAGPSLLWDALSHAIVGGAFLGIVRGPPVQWSRTRLTIHALGRLVVVALALAWPLANALGVAIDNASAAVAATSNILRSQACVPTGPPTLLGAASSELLTALWNFCAAASTGGFSRPTAALSVATTHCILVALRSMTATAATVVVTAGLSSATVTGVETAALNLMTKLEAPMAALFSVVIAMLPALVKGFVLAFGPFAVHGVIFYIFSQVSHIQAPCFDHALLSLTLTTESCISHELSDISCDHVSSSDGSCEPRPGLMPGSTVTSCPNAAQQEWAKHQVISTLDWAPTSMIALYLSNGLSHQGTHHLFPQVRSRLIYYASSLY